MSILTTQYRIYAAQKLLTAIQNDNIFLGIGNITPWSNESIPPSVIDSEQSFISFWKNVYDLLNLNTNTDCFLGIKRNNWTSGTIYSYYDDSIDLFDPLVNSVPFFVVTDDWNVYKCLDNNNGSPSIYEPSGTIPGTFETPDGYIWAYMFTVVKTNLATPDIIPIQYATLALGSSYSSQYLVQQMAQPGTINKIKILNGGSGFNGGSITISGDGSGATATPVFENGSIVDVLVTNVGKNYTTATISVTGEGSGEILSPVISPLGGHGSNALLELGAFYLCLGVQVGNGFYTPDAMTQTGEYRQISLIENPTLYGTTTIATGQNYSQTIDLTLSSISGSFTSGSTVVQSGSNTASGIVLDFFGSKLRVLNITGTFITADGITQVSPSASATVTAIAKPTPSINLYSGNILYIENKSPITRQVSPDTVVIVIVV